MKIKSKKIYDVPRFKDIREVLNNSVKLYPNCTAFILKEKKKDEVTYKNITYTEFQKDVNCLGTALISLGLKGKRIAIISPNRYEWCVSYLAILNGTGIAVPLDKSLPEEEIIGSLERSKADAVIFDKKYVDTMKKLQKENHTIKQYICMDGDSKEFIAYSNLIQKGKQALEKGNKEFLNAEIDENAMSIILFTSGTTSSSKAVMLSHKNIAENIFGLNSIVKIYPTDVSLAFLPFHHTFGSTGFLFFASNGAATAFCDGIRYIPQNLKEYKVSIFVCVPLLLESMYKKINLEIAKQGKTKLVNMAKTFSNATLKLGIDIRKKVFKSIINQLGGYIRLAVSGAAAIDKNVVKGFNALGIRIIQGYGLTETSPVLVAENDRYTRLGSVGIPLVNVDVEIDNPNEKGIGELKAKGPNVMLGYYENEEATKEVLKDGWFYTGDLGYIDKDGFIFITGRKKNVIVLKNGKNIYPEEIEKKIDKLPYVAESMVFGYPKDDDLIVSAKIVYQKEYIEEKYPKLSKEELKDKIWKEIKEINQSMPNYKHIKKIVITDEPMIKTTTQKIKRHEEMKKILEEENEN